MEFAAPARWVDALLLRAIPSYARNDVGRSREALRLLRFRAAYFFTAHLPVLTPLMIELGGGAEMRTVLPSIGVASVVMALSEVPTGVLADRRGSVACVRLGLGLMVLAMIAFFGVAVARDIAGPEPGAWTPGLVALYVLEALMGFALAAISGADSVLFTGGLKEVWPDAQARDRSCEEAIEAAGYRLRFGGTAGACLAGSVIYFALKTSQGRLGELVSPAASVFLVTAVAQVVALGSLRGLDPRTAAPVGQRASSHGWEDWKRQSQKLRYGIVRLVRDSTTGSFVVCAGFALSLVGFARYWLLKPLEEQQRALLVSESGGHWLWFTLVVTGAAAASMSAPRRSSATRQPRFDGESGLRALYQLVSSAPAMLLAYGVAVRAWPSAGGRFAAAAVILLLVSFLRGRIEPDVRGVLLRFAREHRVRVPATMLSAFSFLRGLAEGATYLAYFVVATWVPEDWALPTLAGAVLVLTTVGAALTHLRSRRRGPRIVVIGSYREDLDGLLKLAARLESAGIEVLQPKKGSRYVGEEGGFVRLNSDPQKEIAEIQLAVLHKILRCDRAVLYAPKGRVGTSASMELGFCLKAGVPVLVVGHIDDPTLSRLFLETANDVDDVIRILLARAPL